MLIENWCSVKWKGRILIFGKHLIKMNFDDKVCVTLKLSFLSLSDHPCPISKLTLLQSAADIAILAGEVMCQL